MPTSKLRRRLVLLAISLVLVAVACVWLLVPGIRDADPVERLSFIKDQVRRQFPNAPQISPEELETRMASDEQLVLLDVREPEEYAVSHLEGAIRVDPDDPSPSLPDGVAPDAKVVAYCAVGWRSSKWVEELRAQGVDAVNLEGSIFQWVAEGRPVVRDGEPVDVVHPYSRAWAWLVEPEDRAFTP